MALPIPNRPPTARRIGVAPEAHIAVRKHIHAARRAARAALPAAAAVAYHDRHPGAAVLLAAGLGDVDVAEPGALLEVAGRRRRRSRGGGGGGVDEEGEGREGGEDSLD